MRAPNCFARNKLGNGNNTDNLIVYSVPTFYSHDLSEDVLKAVILAGGLGTRLSEETGSRPKPMVEIGGMPILWHILKIYSEHGISDFIVCCGYKGYLIKEYFANYFLHSSDVTFDLSDNSVSVLSNRAESWKVTLVDTGSDTMTGGRLLRIKQYLCDEPYFLLTYGDGVGNVNITESINFHQSHGKLATMTTSYPPGRFGAIETEGDLVERFQEKPRGDGAMVNSGFFVLSPRVLDRIFGDECTWEDEPIKSLARDKQLMAFRHKGFWQPMDTVHDKNFLEKLWTENNAPWKIW
jgi:glucose-1-phosphate cytidylyltransferase